MIIIVHIHALALSAFEHGIFPLPAGRWCHQFKHQVPAGVYDVNRHGVLCDSATSPCCLTKDRSVRGVAISSAAVGKGAS